MELVEVIGMRTNNDRGRNGWNMRTRSPFSPGVGPGPRRDSVLRSVGNYLTQYQEDCPDRADGTAAGDLGLRCL